MIRDARWFDPVDGAFIVRVECPLTLDEMVAALYGIVEESDIDGDEDLCGSVAVTLLTAGLSVLKERAAKIRRDELGGAIEAPAFLALCRRRVEALLSDVIAMAASPTRTSSAAGCGGSQGLSTT